MGYMTTRWAPWPWNAVEWLEFVARRKRWAAGVPGAQEMLGLGLLSLRSPCV